MAVLNVDCRSKQAPTRNLPPGRELPATLPRPDKSHGHPTKPDNNTNASLFFVGTATTILNWEGFTLMTDPNFLHAGDHVHLGPGVTGTRQTNPAVNIEDLPHIDAILLSHYHADHFDEVVEDSLRRDLPIITTPHAKSHLSDKGSDSFTNVHALDFWQDLTVDFTTAQTPSPSQPKPQLHITGMPGTHIPPGPLAAANDLLSAVPPTNGWMLELGYASPGAAAAGGPQPPSQQPQATGEDADADTAPPPFQSGYRIYISGDTLLFSELERIPELYGAHTGKAIDLMLIHLGGTTIPSPAVPLLMVTMDAAMGVQLMKLVDADVTVPIHYDDYDVFLSPLADFKKAVEDAGLSAKVVYLDRGEEYRFEVRREGV